MITQARVAAALRRSRLIVIVRGTAADWIPEALGAAGVRSVEVSLVSPGALRTLARWRERFDELLVGAGTVLTVGDAREAIAAGAQYLISPGLDERVHASASDAGTLHIPGALTATEVSRAVAAGARIVKLFPAGSMGVDYLRQLRAPFPTVEFVPTGGIGESNAADFLRAGAAALGVGTALVGDGGTAAEVTRLAQRLQSIIDSVPAAVDRADGEQLPAGAPSTSRRRDGE